jgi:hypothetical protein
MFIIDMNGKFFFNCEFVESMKIRTHVPSSLFLEYHDYWRRTGAGTRMNNTCFKKFLNNFLNFIFPEKGMTIRTNIGRRTSKYQGNGMIMVTMGRGNSMGSVKDSLVSGKYRLEVKVHRGILNDGNGIELGNNSRVMFFEYLFHSVGNNDLI